MAKYLIRLDDISWDMDYSNFVQIRTILQKYDIKPIIGVIPGNKDPKLLRYSSENRGISRERFWDEVKELKDEFGWTIAMHGYEHLYKSKSSGILRINSKSEFAGVPYREQLDKIQKGKRILEENGISTDIFMAPAHSYDILTLKALKECGFEFVTDGLTMFPFKQAEIWFIPQRWGFIKKHAFGVETLCIHTNTLSNEKRIKLEQWIKINRSKITDYETIKSGINRYDSFRYYLMNSISKPVIRAGRGVIRVLIYCKNKLLKKWY